MSEVYLSEDTHRLAFEVAKMRMDAAKIRVGVGERRGSYSRMDVEIVGVKAEIAAAYFYGIPESLDFETYEDRSLANRADLRYTAESGRSWPLSVKGTMYPRESEPRLIVPAHNAGCDAYVLVHATPKGLKCDMLGVASKEQLHRRPPTVLYDGAPESYVLNFTELRACTRPQEERIAF